MSEESKANTIAKLRSKPGRAAAINAMCCECIYDPFQPGAWRQQVTECTSYNCPLYKYRPVSKTGKAEDEEDT